MKRSVILAALAAAIVVLAAQGVRAGNNGVKISGGGRATFDFFPGGTNFSVQAQINGSGTPKGHFFCAIPGVVTINGNDLRYAEVNGDGSVTLGGFAHGHDAAIGPFTGEQFEVRLWGGGPGVGRFIYDDTVVGTPLVDTDVEGDHETVASGRIHIR